MNLKRSDFEVMISSKNQTNINTWDCIIRIFIFIQSLVEDVSHCFADSAFGVAHHFHVSHLNLIPNVSKINHLRFHLAISLNDYATK
jgi:hypothetical protein